MKTYSRRGWLRAGTVFALAGIFIAGVGAPSALARGGGDRTRLTIPLVRTGVEPIAQGRAKYEVRSDRRKLNIEVEKVLDAAAVEFFVNGQSVGTRPIVLGTAELELSTQDGANPPVVTQTSKIRVKNAETGAVILRAN